MLDPPDVFVSYSSHDRERVRQFVETLRTFGWSVWWDRELRPGETWDDVIGKALAAARCVVVVWSGTSVRSEWVKIEAEHARQRDALVPVCLEQVPLPPPLGRVHAADLTDWNGEAWHEGLQQTVSAIREKLAARAAAQAHAPWVHATAPVLKEKILDAAVSRELPVGRLSDLIVMVRRADSGGLRAILLVDREYSTTPEDVRSSEGFEIEFPVDAAGRPGRVALTLKVHSADVDVVPPEKRIVVSADVDSSVYAFLVTAHRAGSVLINLDLYQEAVCLASRVLRPAAVEAAPGAEAAPRQVVSMTLATKARRAPASIPPRQAPTLQSPDRPTRSSSSASSPIGMAGPGYSRSEMRDRLGVPPMTTSSSGSPAGCLVTLLVVAAVIVAVYFLAR